MVDGRCRHGCRHGLTSYAHENSIGLLGCTTLGDWGTMEAEVDLMAILRRLDDPEWLESPAGYSSADAAASFDNLLSQISSRFLELGEIDRDIQDSAQYGRIEVSGKATVCGT
ncbi:hypothetical protein AB0877_08715 [Micromonospora sp. NPDC047644]|uniref:hypothetical protein n=1 Tax=Micromonospora sp. NPDC047644 TaxID=3157203 RepID=UPI0034542DFA